MSFDRILRLYCSKSSSILNSYREKPNIYNESFKEAFRSIKNNQKQLTGWFSKEMQSWHTFSRLGAVLIVVLTPHMSGHLMKPIKYTEDFKGAIRNIKNYKKCPKRAIQVFFLQIRCQGTLWNQLETIKTSNKLSRTSKSQIQPESDKNCQKGNFQRRLQSSGILLR